MTTMRTHVAESTIKLSDGVKGSRTILVNVSIKKKTILGFSHKRSQTIAPTYPVFTFITFLFLTRPPYKGEVKGRAVLISRPTT